MDSTQNREPAARRHLKSLVFLALLLVIACVLSGTARRQGSPEQDTEQQFISNLRAHIRHVFVIYQENRSFDSYFGTFPGADNLATEEAREHGFRQYDPIGHTWVTPFGLKEADTADPDHSRSSLVSKADRGKMDLFVAQEELGLMAQGVDWNYARQLGRLTMAHEDCDTVPFLWAYAHRFALYDHIFDGMSGPSTPGNIELIAAQTGQTQWARNPRQAVKPDNLGPGVPVVNDTPPPFGPYDAGVPKIFQFDQTYATVLLTLLGRKAPEVKLDNAGVKQDIAELARLGHQAVTWAWYQEGYGNGRGNFHPAYIYFHNAPQYFGYIRLNLPLWSGVHDLGDFFSTISQHKLPSPSVVFIKGGKRNPFGWKPAEREPGVQAQFLGDDDHPGYSDSQISESLVAKTVNAIARSSYWGDSAILIIWDDPGGFYDHVPPPQFETCPDGHPCGDGPRVPLILISPYAKSGAIVSDPGDHASFAKFLDVLFQLPPLGSLPDEKPYLPEGPRDTNASLTDLVHGFDPVRLAGEKPVIPASDAEIPDAAVNQFPPPMSCDAIGVTPVAVPGVSASPPEGFDPRPKKQPGLLEGR